MFTDHLLTRWTCFVQCAVGPLLAGLTLWSRHSLRFSCLWRQHLCFCQTRLAGNLVGTADDDRILSDVGRGHVVVTPGRDGGRGRWWGRGGHPDSDHTSGHDPSPSGDHGVKLRANAEMETAGGRHAARGLDRVCREALGRLGLLLEVVTWNCSGLLVPTESLVNAGVFAILFLKVKLE